jgi:OOP family OmpA-OmpF porin
VNHRAATGLIALWIAAPAAALTPAFPAPATETGTRTEALGSFALPTGPWEAGVLPVRHFEGRVEARAWRVDAPGLPTLALMQPIARQLAETGFTPVLDCEAAACGGFDFRFAIAALPEPEMHVDLGDFRFLAAVRGDEAVALLVSRSAAAGYVQITRVAPAEAAPEPLRMAAAQPPETEADEDETVLRALPRAGGAISRSSAGAAAPDRLAESLSATGRAVLDDLRFASGASTLLPGDYGSLASLAAWLAADPARRVVLVGHTDAAGGLDANIAVSRRRAETVRAALLALPGVVPDQVTADGVGYLAPLAPNDTEEGRTRNRRVEAVVLTPG